MVDPCSSPRAMRRFTSSTSSSGAPRSRTLVTPAMRLCRAAAGMMLRPHSPGYTLSQCA